MISSGGGGGASIMYVVRPGFCVSGNYERSKEAIKLTCATIHLFADIDNFINSIFIQSLEDDDHFALHEKDQLL